jgi:hypothetical protein
MKLISNTGEPVMQNVGELSKETSEEALQKSLKEASDYKILLMNLPSLL